MVMLGDRKWRKRSLVLGFLLLGLGGVYSGIFALNYIWPGLWECFVPQCIRPALFRINLIGHAEKAYYDNGNLRFVKHWMPSHSKWPYGSLDEAYGVWTSFSPDGNTKYIVDFSHPEGAWVEWNSDGSLRIQEEFRDGMREGTWKVWNKDGTLYSEEHWRQGRLDGRKTVWLDGKKQWEGMFAQGKWNGPQIEWWPNGNIREEREYKNDLPCGRWATYFPDGRLSTILVFPGATGRWTLWYDNVHKAEEGYYLDGKEHGKWTRWDISGKVLETKFYNRGDPEQHPSQILQDWEGGVLGTHDLIG